MLRAILTGVRDRLGRLGEESTEDDEAGFVRSRLDASVLYAHGQGNVEAERELTDVAEEAATLADADERARD
ncbi:MAG: hypothetical protein ABEJ30_00030 [Halorientalis sp.]